MRRRGISKVADDEILPKRKKRQMVNNSVQRLRSNSMNVYIEMANIPPEKV